MSDIISSGGKAAGKINVSLKKLPARGAYIKNITVDPRIFLGNDNTVPKYKTGTNDEKAVNFVNGNE